MIKQKFTYQSSLEIIKSTFKSTLVVNSVYFNLKSTDAIVESLNKSIFLIIIIILILVEFFMLNNNTI